MGSTDAKKLKLDAAEHDAKVQQILTKCPACNTNYSSHRCTRKICKSCCLRLHEEEVAAASVAATTAQSANANGSSDGHVTVQPVCEEHLSKFKKAEEKKARAKAQKEARKLQHRQKQTPSTVKSRKNEGQGDQQRDQAVSVSA